MRQPPRECSVEGCTRPYSAKGLCSMHYYRAKANNGEAGGARPRKNAGSRKPSQPRLCEVEGCGSLHYGRGFCLRHYQRWKDYGDANEPLRRGQNGSGHRGVNNQGYVVLKYGKWTILEHRAVAEVKLGRRLYPFENVHHVNGIKTDNRPENLEVWVKVQPTGQRLEDLITFVTQYYPNEVQAVLGRARALTRAELTGSA
jgi:hypothetical protein